MARTTASTRQIVRDFGTCLNFTPGSSKVVPTTNINPTTGMTIACWVNLTSLGTSSAGRFTDKHATANGYAFLSAANGVLGFNIDAVNTSSGNSVLTLRQWIHIACTYDKTLGSNQMAGYVNGVLVSNGTNTSNIGSDGGNQIIGDRAAGSRKLDGLMDDYHFYTRGLTSTEIINLYNGVEPSTSGLVQWYKFDEGSGASAIDSSGNSNTGNISNGSYSTNVFMKPRVPATGRVLITEPQFIT